jgi:hypothetical protein
MEKKCKMTCERENTLLNKETLTLSPTNNNLASYESFLNRSPNLRKVLKSRDGLFHALKVIASIKPNERFSTSDGIHVQPVDSTWVLSIRRWWKGEDRENNIEFINAVFVASFNLVDSALNDRENFQEPNTRHGLICFLENTQLIKRTKELICNARNGIEHMKSTYDDDTSMRSRIEMLQDKINDQLEGIELSLKYLHGKDVNLNKDHELSGVITNTSNIQQKI